jgi:hypothetical protein
MGFKRAIAAGAIGLLVSPLSLGGVRGMPDLNRFVRDADAIVVAHIEAQTRLTSRSQTCAPFRILVLRVLKGSGFEPGTTRQTCVEGPFSVLDESPASLVFLQVHGRVISPMVFGNPPLSLQDFALPAVRSLRSPFTYSPSASLTDRVASELAASVAAHPDDSVRWPWKFGWLETLPSPVILALYSRFAQAPSTPQKLLGLAGLIRRGDAKAVIRLEQAGSSFANDPNKWILEQSLQIYYRNTAKPGVDALGRMATEGRVPGWLSIAAADALNAIHTRDCLPYYALELDSRDPERQRSGILGFGRFVNFGETPSPPMIPITDQILNTENAPYRTAETVRNFVAARTEMKSNTAKYVALWKEWWSVHRNTLTRAR